jgi:hypothetical protein
MDQGASGWRCSQRHQQWLTSSPLLDYPCFAVLAAMLTLGMWSTRIADKSVILSA